MIRSVLKVSWVVLLAALPGLAGADPIPGCDPTLSAPEIEIQGGEPFFLPEEGEMAIHGPVFPRGRGPGPKIDVRSCCIQGVQAEIQGVGGIKVADVPLQMTFPGVFTGQWGWTSLQGWTVPGEIPVGPYEVVVRSGCPAQQIATHTFYVIFDPEEVGGPERFSFNETGIWFDSYEPNTMTAQVYHLHPDDLRIFGNALRAARGATEPVEAAMAVNDLVEDLFVYNLMYQTNDTLDLLMNHVGSQCADDANMLTAMLRAIGIPAHPVTVDAANETGQGFWPFDTWTEFLVREGNQNRWLILHPHQYEAMSPERRSLFGASKAIAFKDFNDLIIMADEGWVASEVGDANPDVVYERDECLEPAALHLFQASWMDDLCEGEGDYWSTNHWSCLGLWGEGTEWVPEGGFDYGGTGLGTLSLTNLGTQSMSGLLQVELVSDFARSKRFPDTSFSRVLEQQVRLAPQERAAVPVRLRLPLEVPRGEALYLRVLLDGRALSTHKLGVVQNLGVRLAFRGERRVGETLVLTARMTNQSRRRLERIQTSLELPPGVRLVAGPERVPSSLEPGASADLTWQFSLRAPLEAGSLRLLVSTSNGGWTEAVEPLTVMSRP